MHHDGADESCSEDRHCGRHFNRKAVTSCGIIIENCKEHDEHQWQLNSTDNKESLSRLKDLSCAEIKCFARVIMECSEGHRICVIARLEHFLSFENLPCNQLIRLVLNILLIFFYCSFNLLLYFFIILIQSFQDITAFCWLHEIFGMWGFVISIHNFDSMFTFLLPLFSPPFQPALHKSVNKQDDFQENVKR